ncbi:MAG: efflux transporter outer membrane subunit [Dysgonamonadaceae bacterium]
MKRNSIKGIIISGLIALIGLSSCQVMNKYESPKVDSEDLVRSNMDTDTTSIASIPWREYFSDPYLLTYIREALSNNLDMLVVGEQVKQAEAVLGMARAAYFPDLTLSAQVKQTRLSSADPLTGAPKNKNTLAYHSESYSLGLVSSWELDVWGKLNRQSKAKYAQVLNSYAGRNLMQTSLIAGIANTYYALLALDEQLLVTREMVALMQENLETTTAMHNAGMATGAAVEQLRAALASTKTTIPDLESNIRKLENSFCLLLARKPGSIDRTSLEQQNVPVRLSVGIPVQMLANRPDVNQAELAFRSAFQLTQAAKASFYPAVNLSTAMLGYSTTNGLGQFFKPENIFASIAGGLVQPLFARKQLVTQYKIAKIEQQITLLKFEKAVLTAGQEVSDILFSYESSLKKNEDRLIQVEALTKAVAYTQELLKAGEATYLEVISAQQGLLQAKLSRIGDQLEQYQAATNLYRALGGGIN